MSGTQTAARPDDTEVLPNPKLTVLHGTNYWNMGDLALMISLIESLQREFVEPEITILSHFGARTKPENQEFDISELSVRETPWMTVRRGKSRVLNSLSLAFSFAFYAWLILMARLTRGVVLWFIPKSYSQPVRQLLDNDLIISKPGGFLYSYRRAGVQHQTLHLLLAQLSGRPIIIYGQSIGPFSVDSNTGVLKWILKRAKAVLVRDEPSVKVCQELGIDRYELTADEAFLLAPKIPDPIPDILQQENHDLVGMTILEWKFPGKSAESRENYITALVDLSTRIIESGKRILVFPFVLNDRLSDGDEGITSELVSRVDHPQMTIVRRCDPREYQWVISRCQVFVGSRMHSNILALGVHVPVLAIAYQPKTTGIMKMVGLQDYVVDINVITAESLDERFNRLYENRENLRELLRINVDKIRKSARLNAKTCAASVK